MTLALILVAVSCVVLVVANIINFIGMYKRRKAYSKILDNLEELDRELDKQDRIWRSQHES